MIRRVVLGAIVAVALSGCSTFDTLDTGLAGLVGQPLDVAISRLGYPDGSMNVADTTVYVWGHDTSVTMPQYGSQTTSGYVGNTPFSSTTYGQTGTSTVNYECTIRLGVNQQNVIVRYDWEGNLGGCMRYAGRFSQ